MNSKRKTAEQKEKILIDIKNMGVLEGCRKHNISAPTYYQWKRQYDTGGINSLKQRKVDKAEIEQLKKDNAMLKELVAEKEIVIKLQDETIKKKPQTMGERKEIVRAHVSLGLQVDKALEILSIPKSSYYNKRTYNPKGKQATQVTQYQGELVSDEIVIKEMKSILSAEFIDYGYRKITYLLKEQGYQIGKKKVYRLMKENKLLNPKKVSRKLFDKNIIKKKPKPTRPLEIIEIDIKYVYIQGQGKNAYLITMYDTFHREAYEWVLSWSMKVGVIKTLILKFIDNVLLSKNRTMSRIKITFRTDNGCQFTSKMYMQIMKAFEIETSYIPPATPQLNGHIESFHSTVERLVCERYEFQNLEDASQVFTRFYNTYNNERILECLLNKSPKVFLAEWEKGIIEQKEKKNRLIFFFKEEDRKKKNESFDNSINHIDTNSLSKPSPFEVNLCNRILNSARQN